MRSVLSPFSLPLQGRPGTRGPAGADAISDYGFVRYSENPNLAPTQMLPGVEIPFVITQPVVVRNLLKPPFTDHVFLDGNGILRARKIDDGYFIRARGVVIAETSGGNLDLNLYIANNSTGRAGASGNRSKVMARQAGDEEVLDLEINAYPGTGFLANGGVLMLSSSVPAMIWAEGLVIKPHTAAP